METKAQAVHIPRENVNDEKVKLVSWLVSDRERVESGKRIAEVETSKAILEIESPYSGYVRHRAAPGAEIGVGAILCYVTAAPDDLLPAAESVPQAALEQEAAQSAGTGARFSRKALILAQEHGIDLRRFEGRGLVRERDILEFLGGAAPGGPRPGVVTRTEPLSKRKKAEVAQLLSGRTNFLASMLSVLCPTRGLRAAIASRLDLGANALAVVVYEAARLLKSYPIFNSFYHDDCVNYYEAVNIGFAVDSDQGLKVPVIRDADKKEPGVIAREIQDLLLSYQTNELKVQDIAGGTFTITDLSGEDALFFHPLINQEQGAILGLGAEQFPKGGEEGAYQLFLGFDHRLSEGRMAARFLRDLRDKLSSYERPVPEPSCDACRRSVKELEGSRLRLLRTVRSDGRRAWVCSACLETGK
jgi:pyruvate/2-oxoglutarate dehydrogenase complex dihydrolipoamide acyltransferase (E2) component